jgi:hypothetical protein
VYDDSSIDDLNVPAAGYSLRGYYVYGWTAVPLPTLESLRKIRNALRRVNDGVDKAIRDAEQEQVRTYDIWYERTISTRCDEQTQ